VYTTQHLILAHNMLLITMTATRLNLWESVPIYKLTTILYHIAHPNVYILQQHLL